MADPNRALFESALHVLAPVLDELVFVVGGARRRLDARRTAVPVAA